MQPGELVYEPAAPAAMDDPAVTGEFQPGGEEPIA